MAGFQLFKKRLVHDFQEQMKPVRSILDWSVLLYIVVPSMIVFPFFYVDAWENVHLYWGDEVPFIFLTGLFLLVASRGNIRTYVWEADLIYLLQQKRLLRELKRYGFLISLLSVLLRNLVIVFIALPVLSIIYGLDYPDILCFLTIIGAYQLTILTVKKVFSKKLWKWLLTAIMFIAYINMIEFLTPSVYGFIGLIILVTLVLLHMNLAKNTRWLLNEMRIEQRERSKYSLLILKHSVEVEKASHNYNKKPVVLFRNSSRIFKKRNRENGVLELQLKAFLRDRNYMISYAQLMGLTCFALTIVPFWVKIIIYGSFIFFIRYWAGVISRKMLMDQFFQVVPLKNAKLEMVEAEFKKWISYVPIILTSLIILYYFIV
ncbi:ABC transporter permease [Halobacillus salinus]|uniref:ABC transporter permease n=1 Tax=Halobacillus salinus TaxID=192814 RepID=UPI0009A67E5A|nr:ABC transporter permease [Halobacillus salinus]